MSSSNTDRAYRSDWADFSSWCAERGVCALPSTPADLAAYVADLATKWRAATVRRRLAAIAVRHRAMGFSSPTADAAVKVGIARAERELRDRSHPTEPLGRAELRALVDALPDTAAGARDRAMILLGIGAGLRRSELAGLQVARRRVAAGFPDRQHPRPSGIRGARGVHSSRVIARHGCTVGVGCVEGGCGLAGRAGISRGGPSRQYQCRQNVRLGPAAIVKRSLVLAGLDPSRYGVGSLRRGLVFIAARAGLADCGIAAQTGHRTLALVRAVHAPRRHPATVRGRTAPRRQEGKICAIR